MSYLVPATTCFRADRILYDICIVGYWLFIANFAASFTSVAFGSAVVYPPEDNNGDITACSIAKISR